MISFVQISLGVRHLNPVLKATKDGDTVKPNTCAYIMVKDVNLTCYFND